MEVLWLKSHGLAHEDLIPRLAGVSENTMRDYFDLYATGGLDKLKEVNLYRPTSALEAHTTTLEAYFHDHPPATIKEAQHRDRNVDRHQAQRDAGAHLPEKKLHLRCRKVGMIPANKPNPSNKPSISTKNLNHVLAEAQAGQRAVFFVNAAHFVLAPFLGFLWSLVRVFIQAPAGRQRFNVLGALNAVTHELITVTNDTYITAESVCELLHKLADLHLSVPISLVLDNARYQKCAVVFATAASLQIELCFLPAYSPNLNLIERLWKFVKKQSLYSKYYADFAAFKTAITDCLSQTHTTHKEALDSLLTLRFQTFEKAQPMTV